MIETKNDKYCPVCDICGKRLKSKDTYKEAIREKTDEKWRSRKVDHDWIDVCPKCR